MGQSLLPARPKPKFEESFSSWVARLAWHNGIAPGPFCHRLLSHHLSWIRDADRPLNPDTLQILSRVTCTPISSLLETTIQHCENLLFDQTTPHIAQTMITALGLYHRTHRLFGQTYCPRCLTENGYYHLPWRFVFITACTLHRELLWDRCWKCGATVCLHGDSWHCCSSCGADRRRAPKRRAYNDVLQLQSHLEASLRTLNPPAFSETPSAKSFFKLIYDLMKLLHHQSPRIIRLRHEIQEAFDVPSYIAPCENQSRRLESLECMTRHQLLALVASILPDWPHSFVRVAQQAECWASFLLKDMADPHPALRNCAVTYLAYSAK